MCMLFFGSQSKTRDQLKVFQLSSSIGESYTSEQKTLHISTDNEELLGQFVKKLMQQLKECPKGVCFEVDFSPRSLINKYQQANALWLNESFVPLQKYIDDIAKFFEVFWLVFPLSLNFDKATTKRELNAEVINQWCSAATQTKIPT